MNKTVKTLLTIAVASLMLVACDKKEENAEKKASTIEEIQKEKGKPARVVKAATSKLTDVRKFSGTIEGINQNSAILVYSLTYQAMDRTLTDDEVNKAHNKLRDKLVANGDIVLR